MGRRSKAQSNSWQQCNYCRGVLYGNDASRHEKQCNFIKQKLKREESECSSPLKFLTLNTDGSYPGDSTNVPSGYIIDEILCATVDKKDPSNVFGKNYILIHPSAMYMCKIHSNDYVTVATENGDHAIHVAFSSNAVKQTSVIFPGKNWLYKFKHGEKVAIQKYPGEVKDALQIVVQSFVTHEFEYCEEFKDHISDLLCNQIITPGLKVDFKFWGNNCSIKILEIIGVPDRLIDDQCTGDGNASLNCSESESLNMSEKSEMLNFSYDKSLNCSDCSEFSFLNKGYFHKDENPDFCSTPVLPSRLPSKNSSNEYFLPFSGNFNLQRRLDSSVKKYFLVKYDAAIIVQNKEQIIQQKTLSEKNCSEILEMPKMFPRSLSSFEQFKKIKHWVFNQLFPFDSADHVTHSPYGILLYGPPGTGKTLFVRAVAHDLRISIVTLNGAEIYSNSSGEMEKKLKEMLQEARNKSPSILFLDSIDILFMNENKLSNQQNRLVDTIAIMLDSLRNDETGNRTIIIAATNKLNLIDLSLRQPGRFELEVKFHLPNDLERNEILKAILETRRNNLSEEQISSLSKITHGFSGDDLEMVCKDAVFIAIARYVQNGISEEEICSSFILTFMDVVKSLNWIKSHSMKDKTDIKKVKWSYIGGLYGLKEMVQQVIEWPLKYPVNFSYFDLKSSRGILLYGPPGCSKTMIAKAIATESGFNFVAIRGPELFNKWVGESEKAVRDLFQRAKLEKPCVIFFDEIDGLVCDRASLSGNSDVEEKVVSQLLVEMDGLVQPDGVVVVAATNRPDMLDSAILRPGRFSHLVYVPLPDASTRKEIFDVKLNEMPTGDDVNIQELVEKTRGYSGAEIVAICNEAALQTLKEDIYAASPIIKADKFYEALKIIKPRTSQDQIEFYEKFNFKM